MEEILRKILNQRQIRIEELPRNPARTLCWLIENNKGLLESLENLTVKSLDGLKKEKTGEILRKLPEPQGISEIPTPPLYTPRFEQLVRLKKLDDIIDVPFFGGCQDSENVLDAYLLKKLGLKASDFLKNYSPSTVLAYHLIKEQLPKERILQNEESIKRKKEGLEIKMKIEKEYRIFLKRFNLIGEEDSEIPHTEPTNGHLPGFNFFHKKVLELFINFLQKNNGLDEKIRREINTNYENTLYELDRITKKDFEENEEVLIFNPDEEVSKLNGFLEKKERTWYLATRYRVRLDDGSTISVKPALICRKADQNIISILENKFEFDIMKEKYGPGMIKTLREIQSSEEETGRLRGYFLRKLTDQVKSKFGREMGIFSQDIDIILGIFNKGYSAKSFIDSEFNISFLDYKANLSKFRKERLELSKKIDYMQKFIKTIEEDKIRTAPSAS